MINPPTPLTTPRLKTVLPVPGIFKAVVFDWSDFAPQVGLLDLRNKNIRCPVKFEFQINNR